MPNTPLKKRALNRGLSNLLSENALNMNFSEQSSLEQITHLPIEKLQSGHYQPRQHFSSEALSELAESIRSQGIIQPIIARQLPGLHYEIIAGERRFRAAQLAGLSEIPVIIRQIPDQQAGAIALIENIQRENLNALEEAKAIKKLQTEFQLSQQQLAQALGKSRVSITHLLALLELAPEIQDYLQNNTLTKGHAKTLIGLSLENQRKACKIILAKNLSVRDTEKLVQQSNSQLLLNSNISNTLSKKIRDPDIGALERKLSEQLHTPVQIQHHKKGRGKLIIHYRTLESLDNILGKLKP